MALSDWTGNAEIQETLGVFKVMAVLNFKDIPSAKGGVDGQDQWEQFAREFLSFKGFYIDEGPSRGADGGRDLLVTETRTGVGGASQFRWLVSCKHFAHAGRAVGEGDEPDITDRVERFVADGFIGFYSTLPTSGLAQKCEALVLNRKIRERLFFDNEQIETALLNDRGEDGALLCERFFHESYSNWKHQAWRPAVLLDGGYQPLSCDRCGKDLIEQPNASALVAFVRHADAPGRIVDLYVACKGECDLRLGKHTPWWDLDELTNPASYVEFWWRLLEAVHSESLWFTPEASEKLAKLLSRVAQVAMRPWRREELERRRQGITVCPQLTPPRRTW